MDFTLQLLNGVKEGELFIMDSNSFTFSKFSVYMLRQIDSRIKTKGFRKAVFYTLKSEKKGISREELDDMWVRRDLNFVPDAYWIDCENKTVFIFEIEDTNMIGVNKLLKICDAWALLDSVWWQLYVFIIDRYLSNWRVLPVAEVYSAFHCQESHSSLDHLPFDSHQPSIDWIGTYKKVSESCLPLKATETNGRLTGDR